MEIWKSIPGYEGLYEASDIGNIRTCEGKVTSNARFEHRVWKQRVLKQKYGRRKDTDKKDARVTLWKDGIEKTWLVSRLIALAWCDGYFEGATVNHIDGNPINNRADNLEWLSLKENIRHGFRTGLLPHKRCELTDGHGNVTEFISMVSASHFLGNNKGYISDRISKGYMTAKSKDGKVYSITV